LIASDETQGKRSRDKELATISAVGLALSIAWHAAVLLGATISANAGTGLLLLGVALSVASGLRAVPLRPAVRSSRGYVAFEGAPKWMRWLVLLAAGYFVLNFRLATGRFVGTVTPNDALGARIASAAGMLIFPYPLAVFYAAFRRAAQS